MAEEHEVGEERKPFILYVSILYIANHKCHCVIPQADSTVTFCSQLRNCKGNELASEGA